MEWPFTGVIEGESNMSDFTTHQSNAELACVAWLDRGLAWIRNHERTVLICGIGFQLTVLAAMVAMPLTTLVTGDTLLLRVVPVDPRDLFRGDYVILSYDFSRPESGIIPRLEAGKLQEQVVYAVLVPEVDGKHWRMSHYSLEKPVTGKFLRGRVNDWGRTEFGIESYFVQEGEGRMYEEAVRSGKLSAEVAVDGNGRAVLKRLVIE